MLSTIDLPVGRSVVKEDLSHAVEEDDHGVQDLKGDAACDRVVADSFRAVRPSAVVGRTMENGMARSSLMFEVRTYPEARSAGQQLEHVR